MTDQEMIASLSPYKLAEAQERYGYFARYARSQGREMPSWDEMTDEQKACEIQKQG